MNKSDEVLFLDEDQYKNLLAESQSEILKVTHFSKTWDKDLNDELLFSQIAIPALGDLSYEVWLSSDDKKINNSMEGEVEFSMSAEKTFMRIEIHESENVNMEKAGYDAYVKIFELIKSKQLGNFVRAWNYIPNILTGNGDLERYRQFNIGRWNAWEKYGPKFEDGLPKRPAMTGIGSFGGPLVIETMFSHNDVIHLENPRQTQFVHYSKKWGPKPPISARGTLLLNPNGSELYISGTASLVGEEVVHEGDIIEQTKETLKNIEILIGEENLKTYGQDNGFNLQDVEGIRVYIKRKEDYEKVQEILNNVWNNKKIIYVNDDICRPGFLIEIEGIARK